MNIEQVQEYCLKKKGVTEEFPFDNDTLVFKVLNKIFALLPLQSWESGQAAINLKADPDYVIELRENYSSIRPGFHMNKKHWNTVYIYEDKVSPKFLKELIDHSYNMVVKGMTKKMRDSLQ
ncbi:MmcQ/YjbR family DNA-binding protein [Bizionia argentinensis JUB59]|uniref:MmcQ/YjbR family DNA-binding protein n=1 Tax=Bizionia argentinensis JUB59 TaxID=1046627 RepID=G2EAJ0_9FLAO|nr:MmcQ/YjbR family DNA-binding protein [Bizionia argentinensis]EGV44539.1 MmcQ/YjbR family DNA-binding protein [Bizionia argentinensis JUB59]